MTEYRESDAFRPRRIFWRGMFAAAVILNLAACASTTGNGSAVAAGESRCTDPRPEVCTMDYMPVCGRREDGTTGTYPNACGACADPAVAAFVNGTCD